MNQISREPLNGFAPNSQGRRAWSLARKTLDVKVKGQRSRSPQTKTRCALPSPRQRRNGTRSLQITSFSSRQDHSVAAGGISGACVRFMFGKTSFCSSLFVCLYVCLSVTLSTKSMKFGSRYLLHRLSEREEIWHIDRTDLAVHQFQGVPKGAKIQKWVLKNLVTRFSYIVWQAMKFDTMTGIGP